MGSFLVLMVAPDVMLLCNEVDCLCVDGACQVLIDIAKACYLGVDR